MTDNRTTELLREGLAERGIEWRGWIEGVTLVGDWCFVEYSNGRLAATCEPTLTPEQAIAATLGSGECEMEHDGEIVATALKLSVWFCSECGSPTYNDMKPFYCQYCGAKVVNR